MRPRAGGGLDKNEVFPCTTETLFQVTGRPGSVTGVFGLMTKYSCVAFRRPIRLPGARPDSPQAPDEEPGECPALSVGPSRAPPGRPLSSRRECSPVRKRRARSSDLLRTGAGIGPACPEDGPEQPGDRPVLSPFLDRGLLRQDGPPRRGARVPRRGRYSAATAMARRALTSARCGVFSEDTRPVSGGPGREIEPGGCSRRSTERTFGPKVAAPAG